MFIDIREINENVYWSITIDLEYNVLFSSETIINATVTRAICLDTYGFILNDNYEMCSTDDNKIVKSIKFEDFMASFYSFLAITLSKIILTKIIIYFENYRKYNSIIDEYVNFDRNKT